jgi:hypothetical protein
MIFSYFGISIVCFFCFISIPRIFYPFVVLRFHYKLGAIVIEGTVQFLRSIILSILSINVHVDCVY